MSDAGGGPTFEEFVASRGRDLWRSAWLLTGDAHKAEDLVQAALLKCWRRWSTIAEGGSAEAYVRRAMATTYTDWWRRKWRAELPSARLPDGIDTTAYVVEERHDVLAALAALPRGQRAVVVLRFYDDLTVAQTAEVLGITEGTVKSQTSRALVALRGSPMMKEQA